MTSYAILPIEGREVMQKNFATLPTKASNYSGRRVSLNERFAVIERGYLLQPMEINNINREDDVQMLRLTREIDREQLKSLILKETERQHKNYEKNKKKNPIEGDEEKMSDEENSEKGSPKQENLSDFDPNSPLPPAESKDTRRNS